MLLMAVFAAAFGAAFLGFRAQGEKTPDCIHKGVVAGIVVTIVFFFLALVFSYF